MSKSDPDAPKRLALIASRGSLDWAYPPFILASAAGAMEWEVGVFFTFYGLPLLLMELDPAVSSLGIYQHGVFGPGHVLAVLTLLALAAGTFAAKKELFGISRYLQAISYSATLLFHSIPAVTDGLLRLPVGDPVLSTIDDPVLKMSYLGLFVLFLIGITLQLRWIKKHPT